MKYSSLKLAILCFSTSCSYFQDENSSPKEELYSQEPHEEMGLLEDTDSSNLPTSETAGVPHSPRVLRYAKEATPVHISKDDSSPVLGMLQAGDPVVISLEEPWAELGPGAYVFAKNLSSNPIPRPRSAQNWKPISP